MSLLSLPELETKAKDIRRHILNAVYTAQSGHLGSSLSMVEILTTLLFVEMEKDVASKDYFILSKGHAVPCLYAAYTVAGQLPVEQLGTLRQLDSPLQGHPVRGTLPFIDAGTGSLGQGLSIGIGYALGSRLRKNNRRIYVILGDGETQEGQVWEAAMAAAKYKLGHLLAIVDNNEFQLEGPVSEQMPIEPLAEKWASFGWHVQEIDGHSMPALLAAYEHARQEVDRPSVLIAHTVKGKGIASAESSNDRHGYMPTAEEYQRALEEL